MFCQSGYGKLLSAKHFCFQAGRFWFPQTEHQKGEKNAPVG